MKTISMATIDLSVRPASTRFMMYMGTNGIGWNSIRFFERIDLVKFQGHYVNVDPRTWTVVL